MEFHNSTYHNIESLNYTFKAQQSFSSALSRGFEVCTNPKVVGLVLYTALMVSTPWSAPVAAATSGAIRIGLAVAEVGLAKGASHEILSLNALKGLGVSMLLAGQGEFGIPLIKTALLSVEDIGYGLGYTTLAITEGLKGLVCDYFNINDRSEDVSALLYKNEVKPVLSYDEKMESHSEEIYKVLNKVAGDAGSFIGDVFVTAGVVTALELIPATLIEIARPIDAFTGISNFGFSIDNIPVISPGGFGNSLNSLIPDSGVAGFVGKTLDFVSTMTGAFGMRSVLAVPDSEYIKEYCDSNILSLKSSGYHATKYIDGVLYNQCVNNLGESTVDIVSDISSLLYHGACVATLATEHAVSEWVWGDDAELVDIVGDVIHDVA